MNRDVVQFGANLRRERNELEMTQARLAELSELETRTIQKIERGDIAILISTVCRLRRALKCSWDKLLPH